MHKGIIKFSRYVLHAHMLVKKTYSNNKLYYTAFIHFNYWNDSSNVQAIRNRIINNQSFKIVYSEPWFWKCSISKAIKPLIYRQYNDRRIVRRYDSHNFANVAHNEVVEEINNILNEQINLSPPPLRRQYPINAPNLELV